MSHRHRPSLLGALLWTGLGVLFLLRNFGVGPDIWSLASRYWPILLILLGVGKVIDYFLQKDAVSIRVGEIIGILLLLFLGSALTRIPDSHMARLVRDLPIQIGGASVRPGQWIGDSHTYSEDVTYPLQSTMPIRIENAYGSISIAPGSDREVRVRLKKVVYADEARAKNIADEIHMEAASESKGESPTTLKPEAEPGKRSDSQYFVVRTNRETLSSKDYMFNTDMEIFVPKSSQLQVENTFGDLRVAEINGKLDLSTTHRALDVRDCTGEFIVSTRFAESHLTNLVGNVSLDSRSRGRVYLENIKGDVNVTNEYSPLDILGVDGKVAVSSTEGNIRVENIAKPVVIDARGAQVQVSNLKESLKVTASHGGVDISNVASDVVLNSSYATIALKDIRGKVGINSNSDRINADAIRGPFTVQARASSVRLNGIEGPLDIQTTLKDVIVNDVVDSCSVTNEYADISVSAQSLGKGDIRVKNRNGGIDLFLPEEASFLMEATARNGSVETDYAGLQPARNEGNAGVLRSKVKAGGPKITLETDYGNIHISSTSGNRGNHVGKKATEPAEGNVHVNINVN